MHPQATPTRLPRWGPRRRLRCSSLKYSRYSRSSRLAGGAPRPSRCDARLSPRAANPDRRPGKGSQGVVVALTRAHDTSSLAVLRPCVDPPAVRLSGLTGHAAGRQRVTQAAVVSAWSVESIVACVPAVCTTTTVRVCVRQIDSREGRPGSRPAGENSVSCPR